jgi:hypothetical protein
MDDGDQVTMGAVGEIPAAAVAGRAPGRRAAVASMPQGMLAGLMRRNGESWGNLLLRLDEAVMQSVVENRVISDLHV